MSEFEFDREMLESLSKKLSGNARRRAFLVVPPDFLSSLKFEPIAYPESEQFDFGMYHDYGFKMMGFPIVASAYLCDGGCPYTPAVKPVVWKDVQKPASVPAWQWCVVVASLSVLLISMSKCFRMTSGSFCFANG